MAQQAPVLVGGRRIREDANGFICLNDIYIAAGSIAGREPKNWRAQQGIGRLVERLASRVSCASDGPGRRIRAVIYIKPGSSRETYAHPLLAAEYAGFLSPELRLEVLDVWLRFRSGDATLADEILERADDDANLWAATRAQGRVKRREFTDTLKAHGCTKGFDYAHCTNKVYGSLFDRTASQLKLERAVKTTRDGLNIVELSAVMLSEGLASERIQEEQCVGRQECGEAAGISASNVRKAIEADRSSRQRKRLV